MRLSLAQRVAFKKLIYTLLKKVFINGQKYRQITGLHKAFMFHKNTFKKINFKTGKKWFAALQFDFLKPKINFVAL